MLFYKKAVASNCKRKLRLQIHKVVSNFNSPLIFSFVRQNIYYLYLVLYLNEVLWYKIFKVKYCFTQINKVLYLL